MNYLITRESDSDYIEHYGVLGMKWDDDTSRKNGSKSRALMDSRNLVDVSSEYFRRMNKLNMHICEGILDYTCYVRCKLQQLHLI